MAAAAGSRMLVGDKERAAAAAVGAGMAERIAELLRPEKPDLTSKLKSAQAEKGRNLTQAEAEGIEATEIEAYNKKAKAAMDKARLATAAVAGLCKLDAAKAVHAGSIVLENNFSGSIAKQIEESLTTARQVIREVTGFTDGTATAAAQGVPEARVEVGVEEVRTEASTGKAKGKKAANTEGEVGAGDGEDLSLPIGDDFTTTPDYTTVNLGELPKVTTSRVTAARKSAKPIAPAKGKRTDLIFSSIIVNFKHAMIYVSN